MRLTAGRGVAGLLLLTGLVYTHVLGGAFILDDEYFYLEGAPILEKSVKAVFTHDVHSLKEHYLGTYYYYRPVTVLAHIGLARITGSHPFALHLASVLIHAAATVLLFLLALEFTGPVAAWLSAALFLVHPVHVEAVAWMAALNEVLAGALIILSLWALVRTQSRPDAAAWLWALSLLAAAAAFLSKESALALPLLAAVLVGRRAWLLFVVGAGSVALRFAVIGFATGPTPVLSFGRRLYAMTAMALQYANNLVWPWPLAFEYDVRHSPQAWAVFAAGCALVGVIAYRHAPVRRMLLLIIIALAPALAAGPSLPPLRQVQDRYAYMAVMGLALLLGLAVRSRPAVLGALALVALWSTLSVAATWRWHDPEALWTQTLRVTPNSRNAILGLGEWYFSTERFADADRIYRQGLLLRPNDPDFLESRRRLRPLLDAGKKAGGSQ